MRLGGDRLALLQAVSNDAQSQRDRPRPRLGFGATIGQDARQRRHLAEPPPICLALDLDPQHGPYHSTRLRSWRTVQAGEIANTDAAHTLGKHGRPERRGKGFDPNLERGDNTAYLRARPPCDHARFESETFAIAHEGMTTAVDGLSGWRCGACGEVECDAASARRYAAATGDELVLRNRERQRKELRRIRQKLGLSQAEAARLTGGGHNAFSRHERGEATPLPAVIKLFRLLDKHPRLLKEIQAA